jgi:hypothetical protein
MIKPQRTGTPTSGQRGLEILVFLIVSAVGIYALGNGLTGLFELGKAIDLLWLAVSLAAIMLLFAQMGRGHDTWPRRKSVDAHKATTDEGAQEPSVQREERGKL